MQIYSPINFGKKENSVIIRDHAGFYCSNYNFLILIKLLMSNKFNNITKKLYIKHFYLDDKIITIL